MKKFNNDKKNRNYQEKRIEKPVQIDVDDIVYGKNSVIEALSGERQINKVLISKTNHSDNKIEQIKELAQRRGIVFQFVGKEKFAPYNGLNHQGVIAQVAPIEYVELEDFIEKHKENASMVILDGVEDVHNIGAIIRTCVCAGINGILIPSRRNCQITSVVEKTSAGAINHIDIIKVNSLSGAVEKLKDNNWWVIATDAKSEKNYYDIDYCDMNFAIVMGGEHTGVSKTLLKMSDFQVKIPMLKEFNSLNVSNAMSIIVYESVRQKLSKK
ncbi:MAG: 23S rRNA (guanosine(2251)-2'-O)-methyltransferase RlmB [Candidatus Gastranaerophilales bacterium]|nr:23S rRNA (guanosine(2251)-2'-O)-methyltransferase RlmB [Candidatus Gastranaerophilales bacterium]